ncbi:hypothetical protein ASE36_00240 [Rhizobium sp. Root274]|uniref:hypothetical protein n=1 Tax=unclassified Rhizobium TaxID=2613769 RepID=UPI00071437EA|nr:MULTISPECIES: hypothetical protein [unclassified Rhizobium]KQW30767.1 hypothetical protein ASC71_00240 [Rhizobium sp. Root1240]KRD32314.1 hypothetical protein ASE36_00240 [Rhizobium sp. Root274]
MKTATIKAPAFDKAAGKIVTIDVTGAVAFLDMAGKRERFILQFDGIDDRPRYVTHYAKGQKMPGDLQDRAIRQLMSLGHAHKPDYRKMAQALLDEIISNHGVERVRKVIDSAPVLNPAKGA